MPDEPTRTCLYWLHNRCTMRDVCTWQRGADRKGCRQLGQLSVDMLSAKKVQSYDTNPRRVKN
jgi:hypothetical protein